MANQKFIAKKDGTIVEITEKNADIVDFSALKIDNPLASPYATYDIADLVMKNLMVSPASKPPSHDFSIVFRVEESTVWGSKVGPVNMSPNHFEVVLDERQAQQMALDPLAVMTHEVGHALAYLAQQPANKHTMFMNWGYVDPWTKYDAEVEAWDAAEKIFQATRKKCLNSYRPPYARALGFGDKS